MRRWWSDARYFQIVALSSLLLINFFWIDFGAKPLYAAFAIASALITQVICSRLFGLPNRLAFAADHRPVAQSVATRQ
jgi:hypothetical protein